MANTMNPMMARNRIAISVNTAAIAKAVSARLPAGDAAKILRANTMNRMKDTKKSGTAANTAEIPKAVSSPSPAGDAARTHMAISMNLSGNIRFLNKKTIKAKKQRL